MRLVSALALLGLAASSALAQVAITGKTVHTMGPAGTIKDGVVVIDASGKIAAVGPLASTALPAGIKTLSAEVVTPGLVDVRGTVGLTGILNDRHSSDQIDSAAPIQPELRALDAYNPQEPLVEYVRSFGVTTANTGHAWGELVSGQTIIVKLRGNSVEEALVRNPGSVVATLGPSAQRDGGKAPGTRGKMMAMLRQELIKAGEYRAKWKAFEDKKAQPAAAAPAAPAAGDSADDAAKKDPGSPPARDLKLETLAQVLDGKVPLFITANRAQDIDSVLRLAEEFKFKLVLDSAAEAYVHSDRLKASGVPVALHPQLVRFFGEFENASFETAATLVKAGVPMAIQSGFEAYVPKVRVILLEAASAAANGLTFEQALASITIEPAKILGISDRVGSLEVGKDGDAALYTGDPFEYTTHCVGTVIDGRVVFEGKR
jgi:imidazolonepropionase-like amidohydrolase